MFKSLKDRLKGVSERLEDELESELEAELEAELAREMAQDTTGQEADEPGSGVQETAEPQAQADEAKADEPAADAAKEAERTEPAAATRPESSASAEPTKPPESSAPAEPTPTAEPSASPEPAAPATKEPSEPPAEPTAQKEPTAERSEAPEPAKDTEPGPSAPATVSADAGASAAEAEAAAKAITKASEPVAAKPVAKQPITGRKQLSEAEIEARLAREMEEAVEVQKEVETVVQQSGAKLSKYTINEDVLEEILWELEIGLLESDVALPVIEAIKDNVKEQLLSMSVSGRSAHEVVEKVLRTAVRRVLNIGSFDFDAFVREKLAAGKKPVVVMFVGVNGTGKTTSIGRIAWRLKEQGLSPVLAAGDTFRAGAIEQLGQHGDRLGVKVIKHSAGADPAAVAYDAIEHAKARHKDVVLLDTAGRMQTNTNLMDEMDKIRRVANPDLVVFVGDSLAGNDAVEQARKFDEVVDIDGAILTKVDVDAKGGAALSVAYTINKPLLFVGVGQDYPDLRPFEAGWMVDRLFGDEQA